MKKLKNKVFFTIFGILSFNIFVIIIIFNVQNYFEQKSQVINNLNMAVNNDKDEKRKFDIEPKPVDDNIKFMDSIIYTVLLDDSDNIKDIINHSNDSLSNEEIKNLAQNILNNKKV